MVSTAEYVLTGLIVVAVVTLSVFAVKYIRRRCRKVYIDVERSPYDDNADKIPNENEENSSQNSEHFKEMSSETDRQTSILPAAHENYRVNSFTALIVRHEDVTIQERPSTEKMAPVDKSSSSEDEISPSDRHSSSSAYPSSKSDSEVCPDIKSSIIHSKSASTQTKINDTQLSGNPQSKLKAEIDPNKRVEYDEKKLSKHIVCQNEMGHTDDVECSKDFESGKTRLSCQNLSPQRVIIINKASLNRMIPTLCKKYNVDPVLAKYLEPPPKLVGMDKPRLRKTNRTWAFIESRLFRKWRKRSTQRNTKQVSMKSKVEIMHYVPKTTSYLRPAMIRKRKNVMRQPSYAGPKVRKQRNAVQFLSYEKPDVFRKRKNVMRQRLEEFVSTKDRIIQSDLQRENRMLRKRKQFLTEKNYIDFLYTLHKTEPRNRTSIARRTGKTS